MNKLLFFSGAGFSADSGIPTFRGNGLWDNHSVDDICNMKTFRRNYHQVHAFYDKLRMDIADKTPHVGYDTAKHIAQRYNTEFFTSNIDHLHAQAHIPCTQVHGSVFDIVCLHCGTRSTIGPRTLHDAQQMGLIHHAPTCTTPILKPGITFYHESYDQYPGHAALRHSLKSLKPNDVVIVVGSSLQTIPIDYWLRHTRCHRYNINPDRDAGYGHSARYWQNIRRNSIDGLQQLDGILQRYTPIGSNNP